MQVSDLTGVVLHKNNLDRQVSKVIEKKKQKKRMEKAPGRYVQPVTVIGPEQQEAFGRAFKLEEAAACVKLAKYHKISQVELGKGTYGRVYGICYVSEKGEECAKKVVKIIFMDPKQPDDELLKREVYFLEKLSGSGLTPILYDRFACGNFFYIVLERFSTNLQTLALEQAKQSADRLLSAFRRIEKNGRRLTQAEAQAFVDSSFLYTEVQLLRMFEIAYVLGNAYGIVHGDLRPDQFLAKPDGTVVADFGFSGDGKKWNALLGWNWVADCGQKHAIPFRSAEEVRYFNQFQLFWYLGFAPALVLVLKKDNTLARLAYPHYFFPRGHPAYIPNQYVDYFIDLLRCGQPIPPQPAELTTWFPNNVVSIFAPTRN